MKHRRKRSIVARKVKNAAKIYSARTGRSMPRVLRNAIKTMAKRSTR